MLLLRIPKFADGTSMELPELLSMRYFSVEGITLQAMGLQFRYRGGLGMVHFFEGSGFGVSHKLAPGIFYFALVVFFMVTLILPRSLILRSRIFNQLSLGILYFNHPDAPAQCITTAIFFINLL